MCRFWDIAIWAILRSLIKFWTRSGVADCSKRQPKFELCPSFRPSKPLFLLKKSAPLLPVFIQKWARLKNWKNRVNLGELGSFWVNLFQLISTCLNLSQLGSTWVTLGNDNTSTRYKKGDKNPDAGQELLSLRRFAGQPLPGRVSWLRPSSTLASVLCWRTLWLLQTGLVMTGRGAGAHYFPQAVEQARSLRQPGQWCRLRVSIWDEESNAIPGRGGKKRCKKEVLGPLAATAESAGKDSTTGATRKKLVEAKCLAWVGKYNFFWGDIQRWFIPSSITTHHQIFLSITL